MPELFLDAGQPDPRLRVFFEGERLEVSLLGLVELLFLLELLAFLVGLGRVGGFRLVLVALGGRGRRCFALTRLFPSAKRCAWRKRQSNDHKYREQSRARKSRHPRSLANFVAEDAEP